MSPLLPCPCQSFTGYVDFPFPWCNTTATPEEKASAKWDLDLASSSRHSSPLSSSLADTGTLKKAKFLLVRWWVQLPSTDTSALQGAARGLLKVQKAPCAVPWHFGSPLPLPAPHFRVSSPTEDVTQLPVKLCQNHGILQPSANQLCLQFTFICQPEMVLVLMQVRVLRHCLINFWIQVLGALKLSSKSNSPRFLVTLTCLLCSPSSFS